MLHIQLRALHERLSRRIKPTRGLQRQTKIKLPFRLIWIQRQRLPKFDFRLVPTPSIVMLVREFNMMFSINPIVHV